MRARERERAERLTAECGESIKCISFDNSIRPSGRGRDSQIFDEVRGAKVGHLVGAEK